MTVPYSTTHLHRPAMQVSSREVTKNKNYEEHFIVSKLVPVPPSTPPHVEL
jgi:hypothetical protein